MDEDDVKATLEDFGVEVADGTPLVAMRAALKHQCSGREGMTAQQVFDSLDTDDSGYVVVCSSASTTLMAAC